MQYAVVASTAAQRDFKRAPPGLKERLKAAMLELAEDPRSQGKKLAGEGSFRRRVGQYRVVFTVDDSVREVVVRRIKHRREVYRR